MYHTIQEVVATIKQRYEGVTQLSKADDGCCFYGHHINGVGCAIGCLLPDGAIPAEWEGKVAYNLWTDKVINHHFGPSITWRQLMHLQSMHDGSDSVYEFIYKLDRFIESQSIPVDWPPSSFPLMVMQGERAD